MRLLHTADWHLGRSLHGVDLLDAQMKFMADLADFVRSEGVDCVAIAGDVFDRPIPRVEAIRAYEETLERLAESARVIVISGNHDSAVRLGFAGRLLRSEIHFATQPEDLGRSIELTDDHGPVAFHPIPYLDADRFQVDLEAPTPSTRRSHAAAMSTAIRRSVPDGGRSGVRRVAVAHAFVAGASSSDSERDLQVGGLGDVPAEVFDPFCYVALGHLHRCQRVESPPGSVVQYAGSPLRYSFSEADDSKGFLIVDVGANGVDEVTRVPVSQPRPMASISGPLEVLLSPTVTSAHRDAWAQVTVTDEVRPERMYESVKQAFPHVLVVRHQPLERDGAPAARPARTIDQTSDIAIIDRFMLETTGVEATAGEHQLIEDVLATVTSAEGSNQ